MNTPDVVQDFVRLFITPQKKISCILHLLRRFFLVSHVGRIVFLLYICTIVQDKY